MAKTKGAENLPHPVIRNNKEKTKKRQKKCGESPFFVYHFVPFSTSTILSCHGESLFLTLKLLKKYKHNANFVKFVYKFKRKFEYSWKFRPFL